MRKDQGLSQEQLAEKVGISTTHMSHIETGNTKVSLSVFVDIAVALHAMADELLFDSSNKQKQIALEDIQTVLSSCSVQEAKIAMGKYGPQKKSLEK